MTREELIRQVAEDAAEYSRLLMLSLLDKMPAECPEHELNYREETRLMALKLSEAASAANRLIYLPQSKQEIKPVASAPVGARSRRAERRAARQKRRGGT